VWCNEVRSCAHISVADLRLSQSCVPFQCVDGAVNDCRNTRNTLDIVTL